MSKAGADDTTPPRGEARAGADHLPPFPLEALDLPDIDLVSHLWAWWLAHAAEGKGLAPEDITPEVAEAIRLASLGMDTDNEAMAALEKILHRIARYAPGDETKIAEMIRSYFWRGASHVAALDEIKTGKRRQRANARKSRIDGLQSLIIEIMTNDPTVSKGQLIDRLRLYPSGDVIDEVNDEEEAIVWHEKERLSARGSQPLESTPYSALKHRMSRARKKIPSR